jgi:hypothetical protein
MITPDEFPSYLQCLVMKLIGVTIESPSAYYTFPDGRIIEVTEYNRDVVQEWSEKGDAVLAPKLPQLPDGTRVTRQWLDDTILRIQLEVHREQQVDFYTRLLDGRI